MDVGNNMEKRRGGKTAQAKARWQAMDQIIKWGVGAYENGHGGKNLRREKRGSTTGGLLVQRDPVPRVARTRGGNKVGGEGWPVQKADAFSTRGSRKVSWG